MDPDNVHQGIRRGFEVMWVLLGWRQVTDLVWVSALVLGCSGSPSVHVECRPGATASCAAAQGCTGKKSCDGEPPKWSECRCVTTPDAGTEAAASKGEVGNACTTDADCSAPAFCLTGDRPLLFGGTAPAGVCVADCTGHPEGCDAFSNAECVSVGRADGDAAASSTALCFERCTIGAEGPKCQEIPSVACETLAQPAAGTAGYCRPICVSDAQCESGHCDRRDGVCRDTSTSRRLPLGVACDPSAASNDCEGLCVAVSASYAICSHRCVFGDTGECGVPGDGGGRVGGCAFVTPGGSLGDVGYCAELCTCGVDCGQAGSVCRGFGDAALEAAFGAAGVCEAEGDAEPGVCDGGR